VRAAVPLSALGSATTLTSVRGLVSPGDAATGGPAAFDEAVLPDLSLASPVAEVGLAPAGTSPDDVPFASASLADGAFTAALSTDGLAAGSYDVWARACLGSACGLRRTAVSI
jgi:hypothetical protein